jgi:HK97 family phage prohead protease
VTIHFGKVLHGLVCEYDVPLNLTSGYKIVWSGAFDESLKTGSLVEAWIGHDSNMVFGDTRSNLILHSDSYGLWFRVHLRTDTISKHVLALVESKAFTEMSVGLSYSEADAETRKIGGRDVTIVRKAILRECSLVAAGACLATNASLVDAKDCRPLFEDCKSLRMRVDNAADDFMRKLRRLQ